MTSSACYSQEFFGIDVHGFASQGYMRTSDNNYLGNSHKGSFEFNEVGINFQKELMENLRVGVQLFARDLGTQGNNEVEIDWALLDYHWRTWLNIRAGKSKMPYGLYSQGRDVDMLRTSIFLPQSIYNEPQRELVSALEGLTLYGSFDLSSAGSLDYEMQLGTISTNSKSPFINDEYSEDLDTAKRQAVESLTGTPGFTGIEIIPGDLNVSINYIFAFQLIYNTPLEGLRFGVSLAEFDADYSGDFTMIVNFANPSDPSGTLQISSVSKEFLEIDVVIRNGIISTEYTRDNLTLSAEALLQAWWLDGKKDDTETRGGFYLSGSYAFTDWFTLGVYYDVFYERLKDRDGDYFVSTGNNDFEAWQNEFVISGRFDINEHWVVKAELHFVNGTANVNFLDNQNVSLEEDWILFTLKSTVSF